MSMINMIFMIPSFRIRNNHTHHKNQINHRSDSLNCDGGDYCDFFDTRLTV